MTEQEQHDEHVRIITEAASGLLDRWAPQGVTPLAIAEGLAKAAAITLIRAGANHEDAGDVLIDIGEALRTPNVNDPKETVQ